jgi:hypothetical protein
LCKPGHCGSCESKNICGGCRARAYTYFNYVEAPDHGYIKNQVKWIELKNKIPEFQNGNLLINLERKQACNSYGYVTFRSTIFIWNYL